MKCVIFDMDGTLIDSAKAICVTVNEIRSEIGLFDLQEQFIIKTINEPGENIAKCLYDIDNPNMKFRDNFESKFKINYAKFAKVYEGVDNMLGELKKDGNFIALASNAPQETLVAILKKAGILQFFDFIIGARADVPQKPDPTMLNLVIKMGEFDSVIFVGDSKKDELAARNAGIAYLNVSWGFGDENRTCANVKNVDEALRYIRDFSKI
ncbi:MAG: HAD family hydrolase [Campylobacter sp.]